MKHYKEGFLEECGKLEAMLNSFEKTSEIVYDLALHNDISTKVGEMIKGIENDSNIREEDKIYHIEYIDSLLVQSTINIATTS